MNNKDLKIYVAGHHGMVGSAIVRELKARGFSNIVTRSSSELDLTDQSSVREFFEDERPNHVYLAAAKVGGIHANNTYPAEFIYQNLMIESNVIDASYRVGVERLLFLGSSCIYPKYAEQPMKEEALLSGYLEPTNEPYAIAKIAGIKLCESYNRQYGTDFRSVMPTNLYGPGDNYHSENSHVIPALIRRFHYAKIFNEEKVFVWGSGEGRREFLYVEDLAKATLNVMALDYREFFAVLESDVSHLNLGYGKDISIKELAEAIKEVVNFRGRIELDAAKPDGVPRKLLQTFRANKIIKFEKVDLIDGLQRTYEDFLNNHAADS